MGVPQNGWFIRENPTKMDGFRGTLFYGNPHVDTCFNGFTNFQVANSDLIYSSFGGAQIHLIRFTWPYLSF